MSDTLDLCMLLSLGLISYSILKSFLESNSTDDILWSIKSNVLPINP